MQLHFCNHSSSQVWVCIMFYDPGSCGPYGNWGTRGWWGMSPGQCAYVLNTNNRYAYFYAEGADGSVWTGPYGPIIAPSHAFDSCRDIFNNVDPRVNLREVYIASDSHTVNLVG
jgi:hypothetical protein